MAVGEVFKGEVHPIAGVRLAAIESGIRYKNRLDLVLVEIEAGATVAGVFTQNAFCAAPVKVARKNLHDTDSRYFLINTGNANAGTGEQGALDALRCCQSVADIARVDIREVLPFSTGVIGERLPVEKIVEGIPLAFTSLDESSWEKAARGIMTTDTRPKLVSRRIDVEGESVSITGIAKGAGMIKPNMATMLAYVFTDAAIPRKQLKEILGRASDKSFNRITVDGDTSTNDCCMLVATGKSSVAVNAEIESAILGVFQELAVALIKDAEGASKFITVHVEQGANSKECLAVAYAVAESPLVKTALFASDPNWGRILAAVGRAGLENLDIKAIEIRLGEVQLVSGGEVSASYTEALGQREMDRDEITLTICLGRGDSVETVWTSDLSLDYIRINADYRS
jgi:glutamate N-acetyltransferase/amino-acid N-acetyltransferase